MKLLVIILYEISFLLFLIGAVNDGDTTNMILSVLGLFITWRQGLDIEY